ncbi:MAG: hypothetical protein O3A00_12525, partial [Planctomycetota bacterium]|nr:hypothetical protein [Planctomycetota bacterium]
MSRPVSVDRLSQVGPPKDDGQIADDGVVFIGTDEFVRLVRRRGVGRHRRGRHHAKRFGTARRLDELAV